jgi:hypothetical protein
MEQKNNIVEKALAILYRQPEKLEAINQSEQKRSATLSGVREVWRRLFNINVDATRKAAGLSSLEDHVRTVKNGPTPLVDALLANTENAEGGATEREIQPPWFREGKLERTGRGRKGSPFRYVLPATLLMSSLSLPIRKENPGNTPGRESQKDRKASVNTQEILFQKKREENGKRMEENLIRTAGSEFEPSTRTKENS